VRRRSLPAAVPLLAALLAPAAAVSQPFADPGPGVGLLGFYARTTNAQQGTFLGGAQALTRFTGVLGVELFVGYRSDTYENEGLSLRVQQVPVQLSVLAYLTPNLRVQPYLLGGGGYYRIWGMASGPQKQEEISENKLGLHAGAGIDIRVATRLSLRVEGRYVFVDIGTVLEKDLSANSWQVGGGFNYYF
jgi:opacity protein-like surface antigen